MSEPADIAARTQRFNEAAREFTPPSPTRHAKLMSLKDGIVGLRQKGASLRLTRELLATVDVTVGTDTIARFLAEVNGDATAQRPSKRSSDRRAAVRDLARGRIAAVATLTEPPAVPETTAPPPTHRSSSEACTHARSAPHRPSQPVTQRTFK
jgi:hypothetical protein